VLDFAQRAGIADAALDSIFGRDPHAA
jgi:hypothetical protein